ncbi:MAG: prolyl oligopeptidase family serine peptidase, partial [Candidatus Krumholzibacteriota bacterium]|nr:prolyl oligopeptidase family serine peptidase [Candidatus Krumholzibacteriota bacterium]
MANGPLEHVSKAPENPGDDPSPAVVLIHGRGTNEQDLLPIAAQLPDELHVLSVRAPDRLQGGYTWYELDLSAGGLHASQPHKDELRRSLDLLSDFVEWAIEEYALDPERIGLLGFSQGSIMSLAALCEQPEAYSWIVALNGYLAESHEDSADEAREHLREFVRDRLDDFGPYEDAISAQHPFIAHSMLTAVLNIGLLDPREVVRMVIEGAGENTPLASVEGFVRQVIGWREYMRATYRTRGRRLRTSNRLDHQNTLGEGWWDARTGLAP